MNLVTLLISSAKCNGAQRRLNLLAVSLPNAEGYSAIFITPCLKRKSMKKAATALRCVVNKNQHVARYFLFGFALQILNRTILIKGVEKYSRPIGLQLAASWTSRFFSFTYRLSLIGADAHPIFFGFSSPLWGSPILFW